MNSNDPHSGTIQSKTGRAESLLYQFMGRRAIVKPDAGATEKAGEEETPNGHKEQGQGKQRAINCTGNTWSGRNEGTRRGRAVRRSAAPPVWLQPGWH